VAYSLAGLLLFVDSVNASIGPFEVAKRVSHLLDARDVPEELASCAGEVERGGFDVVDPETEHDPVVEAVGGIALGA
jgi:hypothetical protein